MYCCLHLQKFCFTVSYAKVAESTNSLKSELFKTFRGLFASQPLICRRETLDMDILKKSSLFLLRGSNRNP